MRTIYIHTNTHLITLEYKDYSIRQTHTRLNAYIEYIKKKIILKHEIMHKENAKKSPNKPLIEDVNNI